MPKKIVLYIMFILLFSSCSSLKDEHKLKISATTWVGYAPLFYAKEKGWLDDLNIKLLNVSSLAENMYIFKAGNAHAYVGTQYEYSLIVKDSPSLIPIMLFDRSYGGDIIMSDITIEALKENNNVIDVYLEIDSINMPLFRDFVKKYELGDKNFNFVNMDQNEISILDVDDIENDAIVVTYSPYDIELKKHGFKEIASTKDSLDLLVIDAMFTYKDTLTEHKEQFVALKKLVKKAVDSLENDPKEFYDTIKQYILEINYEDFVNSLDDIIWVNEGVSQDMKERMDDGVFPTKDLI